MIKRACATLELSRAMVFRLLARYKQDPRFSVLLPRRQGRKRGSHALLEGQERMISLQIQKVARTGENPSLAALHRKIAAACRKRRLPIPSYGTYCDGCEPPTRAFPEGSWSARHVLSLLFNGKRSLHVNGKNGMKLQKSTN